MAIIVAEVTVGEDMVVEDMVVEDLCGGGHGGGNGGGHDGGGDGGGQFPEVTCSTVGWNCSRALRKEAGWKLGSMMAVPPATWGGQGHLTGALHSHHQVHRGGVHGVHVVQRVHLAKRTADQSTGVQ